MSIGFFSFLEVAVPVFFVWRLACWFTRDRNAVREVFVWLLFVYALAVVNVTFFPMRVIFYDWYGRLSLVPFASTTQLVRDSDPRTAITNIGGNILLFMPLGILLPLLFRKTRFLWSLVWRAALVSVGIELLQFVTQIRATDVDDIILNVLGAIIGFELFRVVVHVVGRRPWMLLHLQSIGTNKRRHGPLRAGLIPAAASLVLMLVLVVAPAIFHTTLDEQAVKKDAILGVANGSVVVRCRPGGYEVLVTSGDAGGAEVYKVR